MQKAGKQLSFNRFPQRHQVQRVLILVCTNFAFACRLSKEALVGYIWKYWKYWKMCDAQLQILENVTRFFDCTVYSFCSFISPQMGALVYIQANILKLSNIVLKKTIKGIFLLQCKSMQNHAKHLIDKMPKYD